MAEYLQEIPLWEKEAIPFTLPEDAVKGIRVMNRDNGVLRYTDVTVPTITFYPAVGTGPHPAVLVAPGGGYRHLAYNSEGCDICSLLNVNGFSCFLLKYRCPDRRQAAHADAARAMRLIRARAEEFEIDPEKAGAIGFSAGAHLCATITAPAEENTYPAQDAIDACPYRSNFTALIYPAYLADDDLNLSSDFKIDEKCPPCFILQSENDSARVENAVGWFMAMKRAGVKAELHTFAEGGHGYGLRRTGDPISDWGILAAAWFRRQAGVK